MPLRVLPPTLIDGHIGPAMVNTVVLELFIPLKWAWKIACVSTALVFLVPRNGRLQHKAGCSWKKVETFTEQWDEVWKCHLVEHTHPQVLWIHLLPLFLLFPYLLFVFLPESKPSPFFLILQSCILCNGCRIQDKRNNQPGEGCDNVKHARSLKQFHYRLIFLSYQTTCIVILCLSIQMQVCACCGKHRVKLITGSNLFLSGIILRIRFAHRM